jgi:hypothetical protein
MSIISFYKHSNIFAASTLIVLIATTLFSGLTYAGAWTGPKGDSYNKFGINYFESDQVYDRDGNKKDSGGTFTDLNFTYYGEYGFQDSLSGFVSFPYKSVETKLDSGPSASTTAVGDIDVGVRYNLLNNDKGVFSLQGLVKIPEAYDENDIPPVGNGQYDFEVRALYGKSLYPKPFYFGLEGGYRFRADEPSDEWKYLLELGYTASDKIFLRTKLDGTMSAKNADKAPPSFSGNPTLAPDYDLGKLELTAGYTIVKDMYLEFTWTPTIYGRDTAAGNTFGIAFIYAGHSTQARVMQEQ